MPALFSQAPAKVPISVAAPASKHQIILQAKSFSPCSRSCSKMIVPCCLLRRHCRHMKIVAITAEVWVLALEDFHMKRQGGVIAILPFFPLDRTWNFSFVKTRTVSADPSCQSATQAIQETTRSAECPCQHCGRIGNLEWIQSILWNITWQLVAEQP